MRKLYLDCSNGISGDMTIGALIALGADKELLAAELKKLGIHDEYELVFEDVNKYGIDGVSFDVKLTHHHEHSHGHHHEHHHEHSHGRHHEHHHEHSHTSYAEIKRLILKSTLAEGVKQRAIAVFEVIAQAEAQVHGRSVDEVMFHEVGAVDSIVDIVGAALLLESLKIDEIVHSDINVGGGTVKCAHGVLPVPAPATQKLIIGKSVYGEQGVGELTTPTGAGILCMGKNGAMPRGRLISTGRGFGKKDIGRANMLTAMVVEESASHDDEIIELAANIDDMTGEELAFAAEMLMKNGAKDAWAQAIIMKKGRPAYMLCALCLQDKKEELIETYFKHTSTLGVRYCVKKREMLEREFAKVSTPYGEITVKRALGKPEFEDVKKAALENGVSLREVVKSLNME